MVKAFQGTNSPQKPCSAPMWRILLRESLNPYQGNCLSESEHPVQYCLSRRGPPTQGGKQIDLIGQQRYAKQQYRHISKENDDRGKDITLFCNVRLLVFQDVPGERDVESIGRPEQQVEPYEVIAPVPKPIDRK